MRALRVRLAVAIVVVSVGLVAALTAILYTEAAQRIRGVDGSIEGLARSFGLFGASACVLLVGLAMWQLGRGLEPIEQMAIELRRVQERVEGALEREREFSGHLAHELRTPLAVMRTGLDLALRRQSPGSEAHFHLVELLETVDEMHRLTDNLLLLARVERGAETTQMQSVPVRSIVDAVWRRLEDKAGTRGLSFDNRLPEDHCIRADRGKLHLVVQNLLGNAVSYTEAGGSIVVAAEPGELLSVWDSGPQLPSDALTRVFDRLWRADMARTDATQHAGLGLSLARALCRHMAMELAAENVDSGGLRFVLTATPRRP